MGICFNDITSLLYGWAMIRTITASILLGWETWYVTYDVNNILFSKWQHQLSLNFWMTLLLSTVSVWNMVHRIYDLFMLPRFVSRVESVIGRISTYHDIHRETSRSRNNCINFAHCTDLGNHVLILYWSLQQVVLQQQQKQEDGNDDSSSCMLAVLVSVDMILFWTVTTASLVVLLGVLLLASWSSTSRGCILPGLDENNKGKGVHQQQQQPSQQLSIDPNSSHLVCSCPSCNNETSLCFYPTLCRQWMIPVQDVLVQMGRPHQQEEAVNKNNNGDDSSVVRPSSNPSRGVVGVEEKQPKEGMKTTSTTTTDDLGNNKSDVNGWRCACEGGFLPPGLLKSFGGAEAIMRLGTGQCYHKQL
jgi:hypothetical protein